MPLRRFGSAKARGEDGVQGSLESPQGQHHAGATRAAYHAMNIRDDPPERTATNKGTAPGQGLGLQVRVGSLMSRLVIRDEYQRPRRSGRFLAAMNKSLARSNKTASPRNRLASLDLLQNHSSLRGSFWRNRIKGLSHDHSGYFVRSSIGLRPNGCYAACPSLQWRREL